MHRSAQKFLTSHDHKSREQFLESMNLYLERDSDDELMIKTATIIKELRAKLAQHIAD